MKQNADDNTLIEIRIKFWKPNSGFQPKHCQTAGAVRVTANRKHGIKTEKRTHFNSIAEISGAVEQALVQAGVKLHPERITKKYLAR